MYRAGHIGTKELEILLRDYLKINQESMTYEQVEQFDHEILSIENPSMQRYFINGEPVIPEHDVHYVRVLIDYIDARKKDYSGNIPKNIDL